MEIIGQIYEALEDDEALEALPDIIAKEIGSRSCTLQLMTPEFQLEGTWITHFTREMYSFYLEHNLHLFDAWTKTNMHVFGTDRTERHTDFLPLEKFRNSFFYNEFIRRFGDDSAYCLGFISTRPDGGYLVAGLQKGLNDKDFTDEQVARFDKLRPHLTRMMVLRRNLMVRDRYATGALLGIDSLEDAYLVVRKDRCILFANASAESLLRNETVIKAISGDLFLAEEGQDCCFLKALMDASTNRSDGQASFAIRGPDNDPWRFTVAPKRFDQETMLLVWIERAQPGSRASQSMQRIYGLTDSEVPVLNALSEGMSASEIGDCLKLSVATVRSHLQHIYQKTGCNKATQVAKLVATLPKV